MKIMAPVNSYKACVQQIAAGANELYVGMEDETFNTISFSGRGRVNCLGIKINPSYEELCTIVEYAHQRDVIINFTANTICGTGKCNMNIRYLDYVKKALEAGVDTIIVGDLGNILFLRTNGINLPIVASVFMSAMNIETINLYKNFGVTRVVLPHHMKLEEVAEIKMDTDIEVEIFAGVGCSNIDGRCGFLHNSGEDLELGIPCKAQFEMDDNSICNFLDSTLDCLICSLPTLYNMGIDVLKIIGRDQDINFTAAMTKIHSNALKMIEDNNGLDGKKLKECVQSISWWKKEFCDKDKCKYKNNIIEKSFI